MKKTDRKYSGQVFTPQFIVDNMLDNCEYKANTTIINKHIIDNSCGCGAFLCEVVKRYCTACNIAKLSTGQISDFLSTYIHGLDSDISAVSTCINNLNNIVEQYGIVDVNWDIHTANTLKVKDYNNKMDFVVGNPPYVRVHNLKENYEDVKGFAFNKKGMTDLYLAFYELGFSMLSEGGKLCYITPNSWLNSTAAASMRKYIMYHKNIVSLIDLGHFQPFENATTYTLIALFIKGNNSETFKYYTYDQYTRQKVYVCDLTYSDIYIDGNFYPADYSVLNMLHNIKMTPSAQFARVKNGFATLSDNVFINDTIPDSPYTIRTIKASTGKWHKCFYPYDSKGKPIDKAQLFSDKGIKQYMELHRQEILKGRDEFPGWYLYGRTQALADVGKQKIAINTIIKDIDSIKIEEIPAGCGVYSGLYILTNVDINTIRKIIVCEEFIKYVSLLKKYKSGGYYTFSSKDIEQYINYKLTYQYDKRKQIA